MVKQSLATAVVPRWGRRITLIIMIILLVIQPLRASRRAAFKNLHFSTNSGPTPLLRTLRGEIDPVDSENDNESID